MHVKDLRFMENDRKSIENSQIYVEKIENLLKIRRFM